MKLPYLLYSNRKPVFALHICFDLKWEHKKKEKFLVHSEQSSFSSRTVADCSRSLHSNVFKHSLLLMMNCLSFFFFWNAVVKWGTVKACASQGLYYLVYPPYNYNSWHKLYLGKYLMHLNNSRSWGLKETKRTCFIFHMETLDCRMHRTMKTLWCMRNAQDLVDLQWCQKSFSQSAHLHTSRSVAWPRCFGNAAWTSEIFLKMQ